MISHDFFYISEGFRSSDEGDLIGSKLLNSPRSKGEFVPVKYSSSIDNSRYLANYADKFDRQIPQTMKVVTFTSAPKDKAQPSKINVSRKPDDAAVNGEGGKEDSKEASKEQPENSKEKEMKEGVLDNSKKATATENGKVEDLASENGKVEAHASVNGKLEGHASVNGKADTSENDKAESEKEKAEAGDSTTEGTPPCVTHAGRDAAHNASQDAPQDTTQNAPQHTTQEALRYSVQDVTQDPPLNSTLGTPTQNGTVHLAGEQERSIGTIPIYTTKVEAIEDRASATSDKQDKEEVISGDDTTPTHTSIDPDRDTASDTATDKDSDPSNQQAVGSTNGADAPSSSSELSAPSAPSTSSTLSAIIVNQATKKQGPTRALSAKALTPREFVPRDFVPQNVEPLQVLQESTDQQKPKNPVILAQPPPTASDVPAPTAPVPVPVPVLLVLPEPAPKIIPPPNGELHKSSELKKSPRTCVQAQPQQKQQSQLLIATQPIPSLSVSGETFIFSKDLGFKTQSVLTMPSALSVALMERSTIKNKSKLQIPDYRVPGLQLVIYVLIHSSFLPNKLSNIRVHPSATVESVIDVAVKKLNDIIEKHRPEDPPLQTSKCQLLLAEEDGRPDTDTPVLQRDAAVNRFGCMYFALCKDPELDGSGYTADSKTFKVVLPSKEYQVLSYKRSLSLGQVLEKVCSKRQLDPLVHYFVYTVGHKDAEINLDTLVSDLETTEVTMKCRLSGRKLTSLKRPTLRSRSRNDVFTSDSGDTLAPPVLNPKVSRHLGMPKEFFWSPASVATYVQYAVIKINKYGKKQERIMGIDRERITNSMPRHKTSNKTNRPTRMMTDVIRAFITDRPVPASPSSRKPFSIEFNDNIQEYESEKADEIVARINYIVSLQNDTPRNSM